MSAVATATAAPVLDVSGLSLRLGGRDIFRGVNLSLTPGETLVVVGPSGAGKSSLARVILGWLAPDAGQVTIAGLPWSEMPERKRRPHRSLVQLVYQDPSRSLDPMLTVGRSITEGAPEADAAAWAARVGLPTDVLQRLPSQLSGGQCQRVAIARACCRQPQLLVADEPTASLDPPTAAGIFALLGDLQRETGMACLLITHQIAWARALGGRVAILAPPQGTVGGIVETGITEEVLAYPRHALTRALLEAIPPWPPVTL